MAWGTAARTLALAALAVILTAMLVRQLARLAAVRDSLNASHERFALAVAGSDDGIWDWDGAHTRCSLRRGRASCSTPRSRVRGRR